MARRCYLDANATSPLRPVAREAMLAALEAANPSSAHGAGKRARRLVEDCRAAVLDAVNARCGRAILTSGATEAATLALTPDYTFGREPVRFDRLLVAATEHPCVLEGGRFGEVSRLSVDRSGLLDLGELDAALAGGGRPLVAVMLVNNETGVVQPIAEIARRVHAVGGTLVCDAVQAVGRMPVDMEALETDLLLVSSHKVGGPMGAGALVSREGRLVPRPMMAGGPQEDGHRSGTENVPALAGFAAALRTLPDRLAWERLRALRDGFEAKLTAVAPTVTIHGTAAQRAPNTSLFSFARIAGETAQIAFDLDGTAVSTGSACASGKVARSHVLDAMGVGAPGAIRISLSAENDQADLDIALRTAARLGARDAEKLGAEAAAAA